MTILKKTGIKSSYPKFLEISKFPGDKIIFFLRSYVRDGILYIKPTLTADRFSEDFLYNGVLDLYAEGCNVDIDGGCYV